MMLFVPPVSCLLFLLFQLTPGFRKASYSLEKFVQYLFWPYMRNDPFTQNPNHQVSIKMQLDPFKNGMTLNITTPFEDTKIENVPLPFNMLYEPGLLSMRKSLHKKLVDSVYGVDKSVCLIDRKVVKTFDNVTLERQPSDCWTLMAADSSLTRNIAIYEKVQNQQPVVRVFADRTEIEIDSSSLKTIQVDGKQKSIKVGESLIVPGAGGKPIAEILMLADDTVKMYLPEHYAKLLVTREGVQIRGSMLAYRNRVRGVCGDFNGEQRNDLVSASGCVYKNGQKFYESYHAKEGNPSRCIPQPPKPEECVTPYAQGSSPSQSYSQNIPATSAFLGDRRPTAAPVSDRHSGFNDPRMNRTSSPRSPPVSTIVGMNKC